MNHTYTSPAGTRNIFYQTLLEQPHVLIAGSMGSGKSVVINGLIYTALFKFPYNTEPEDDNNVGLILIDPKRVELSMYNDLPHTIKYASEPEEIVQSLQYAMYLTESRYREMQQQRVRTYQGSHIYIMIDEFADLMTTDKKRIKPLIQRLAQIARAARVHLVTATQNPLCSIIPTDIKVNFDAILGLRTATAQHSRNIIGIPGCECLPNPLTEHRAMGYYRNGADLYLHNLEMIPEEELDARVKWWVDQKPKGFLRRLFGR